LRYHIYACGKNFADASVLSKKSNFAKYTDDTFANGKINDELGNPDDNAAHAGDANSSDSEPDDSLWGTITNYFGGDDKSDNEEVSNEDNNNGFDDSVTDGSDSGNGIDSDGTIADTSNTDNDDQDNSNDDSDDEDDDENENGGNSDTASGGMEIDQGPDDNSIIVHSSWINQNKVKDTQANGPGGKGTVDFALGEEGGSVGEGGIGSGHFKDMRPSQVHTVDGIDAISYKLEDQNQNIQDNIKNGGPTTMQIHTTQE